MPPLPVPLLLLKYLLSLILLSLSLSLSIGLGGKEELRVKLQNFRDVRKKLDDDILMLERALGIIGDACL
jgi:hypothetical protein